MDIVMLRKLPVSWKPYIRYRRMSGTLHGANDPSSPRKAFCRAWFVIIIMLSLLYYVYYIHIISYYDIIGDLETIDTNALQVEMYSDIEVVMDEGNTSCWSDCNFQSLSKEMRVKMAEAFMDNPDGLLPCELNMLELGSLQVNNTELSLNLTRSQYPTLRVGGHHKPVDCQTRHKVAVIVPYRDREANLNVFLFNIHSFLMNQKIEYQIFVVEQIGNEEFNQGRLLNAGFEQAYRFASWHCLVFHDVDLLPLDQRIFYSCPSFPRHMSTSVLGHRNESKYFYFGGVASMTKEHFLKVNGYSNSFWGCCGIDLDMFWRIRLAGLRVIRYDMEIAKYLALPHSPTLRHYRPRNRRITADTTRQTRKEGLSTVQYKVVNIRLHMLYTHVLVDVNPPESLSPRKSIWKFQVYK